MCLPAFTRETGKQLTLAKAVEGGLLDLRSGTFRDPRSGRNISLDDAVRLGFIDKDVLCELNQKCGLRDPKTGRELTLLEAMQKGLYDPVSGKIKDPRSGTMLTPDEALAHGIISPDMASKLSYIRIATKSTSHNRGYYGLTSTEGTALELSIADAMDKGLYNSRTGKFIDPVSREELTLSEALQRKLISADSREIVHPVTGEKLSVADAIRQGILDPRSGQFRNPRTGLSVDLNEARNQQLIDTPMSLHSALTEGVIGADGDFTDKTSGRKLTLFEAIERGLLDTEFRCIVDPRTNEVLSLQEAIERGLINKEGLFVDPYSGSQMSLHEAVNQGLARVLSQEITFADRVVTDTITGEKLSLSEAVQRGYIDPNTGTFTDKRTGREMSIEAAVRQGLVEPELLQQLNSDSGLKDIMGNSLTVAEALKRGLIDPRTGHVTDPSSGRSMSIEDAAAAGLLESDKAKLLLDLTSPVVTSTTVTSEIRPSSPTERPTDAITVQEAVHRGLVSEENSLFTDPITGRTMSLDEAVSKGFIRWSADENDMDGEPTPKMIRSPTDRIPVTKESEVTAVSRKSPSRDRNLSVMSHGRNEEHMVEEDSDEYTTELDGGQEKTREVTRKEYHAKHTDRGFESVAIHEAKQMSLAATRSSVISGELPLPLSVVDAMKHGLLNTDTGMVKDPHSGGERMPLEDAFKKGILNANTAIFKDPRNRTTCNVQDAIEQGSLDSTGHYIEPRTRTKLNLDTLIKKGIVTTSQVPIIPGSGRIPVISETRKMMVKSAIDPKTGHEIDTDEARRRGILDTERGVYVNTQTGVEMSIQDAIDQGLMVADSSLKTTGDFVTTKAIKESKSYTISGAVDPNTGKKVEVGYALQKGIIDQANGEYVGRDARGREMRMPISEAIKKGYVVAEATTSKTDVEDSGPKYLQETKTFTISGVVDPIKGIEIPVSEAIRKGILDQGRGQYVNPATGDIMLITEAVSKGLILAEIKSSTSASDQPLESTLNMTKQTTYTVKSLKHPVTGKEITIEQAIAEGILDQEHGVYRNPHTFESMTLSDAIDQGLVSVELGRKLTREERDEKVPSLEIDDELDAMEEMAQEEVTEESKTFQITGVADPESGDMIPFHDAILQGLINEDTGMYVNNVTGEKVPITEALNQGIIVGQLVSQTGEQELFKSAYICSRLEGDITILSVYNPISGTQVNVPQAMRIGLLSRDMQTYYNPETDERIDLEEAIQRGWVTIKEDPNAKKRAPPLEDGEQPPEFYKRKGKRRAIIDWGKGVVRDSTTGMKMKIADALKDGLIDKTTAELLTRKAEAGLLAKTKSKADSSKDKDKVSVPGAPEEDPEKVSLTIQTTDLVGFQAKSITVTEQPHDTSADEPSLVQSGILSFENAVKLGLYNVKTGVFRDPVTGHTMSLQEAISQGLLDGKSPAIVDIKSGKSYSLIESLEENIINQNTGIINETKIRSLRITLDPLFSGGNVQRLPGNLEDAILIGLLDPATGNYMDPVSGKTMNLKEAVDRGLLHGDSVVLVNPGDRKKYTLNEALRAGIVDKKTGGIIDAKSGNKIMTLEDAVRACLVESIYKPDPAMVINKFSGEQVPLDKGIKDGLVNQNERVVYEPRSKQRITVAESIERGILDEETLEYFEQTTRRRLNPHETVIRGLMVIAGAPIIAGMGIAHGIKQITETVLESTIGKDKKMLMKETIQERYGPDGERAPITSSEPLAVRASSAEKRQSSTPIETDDVEPKRRAAETKTSDTTTEVTPVKVTVEDGQVKATSKLTMKSETTKLRETVRETLPPEPPAKPIEKPRPQRPSIANTVYHPPTEVKVVIEPGKTAEITTELDRPNTEVEVTIVKLHKKQEQMGKLTTTRTEITEVKKYVTRSKEGQDFWEEGYFVDPQSGEKIGMKDAIERELIEIDWRQGLIKDAHSGDTMTPEEAVKRGLIDSHIESIIETRMALLQTDLRAVTLNEAATNGLLIIPIGRIRNPITEQRMTLEEAIDISFLDADYSVIIDPSSGKTLTLRQAIDTGIIDPHSGNVTITGTGKVMTLTEACLEGLIPEHGITKPKARILHDAIQEGLIDVQTGMYTDPETGNVMEVEKAIKLGYIQTTDSQLTVGLTERTSQRHLPSRHRVIPLDKAVEAGFVDTKEGTFRDPTTGEVMSLANAIAQGYISAPAQREPGMENKDGIDFEEAMNQGLIDLKSNTFTEPITEVLIPLDTAIRKGYVIIPEGGVKVRITEEMEETYNSKTSGMVDSSKSLTYEEAVHKGLVDPASETYIDPKSGQKMSIKDAAKFGLLAVVGAPVLAGKAIMDAVRSRSGTPVRGSDARQDMAVSLPGDNIIEFTKVTETRTMVEGSERGMPIVQALNSGQLNPRNGAFMDKDCGTTVSLQQAFLHGKIDPRTASLHGRNLTEAIENGWMNSNGHVSDPHTGDKYTLEEAMRNGLVQEVNVKDEVKMKITRLKETIKLQVHAVVDTVTNESVSLNEALLRNLLDTNEAMYYDHKNGKSMPIAEAYDSHLIQGRVVDVVKSKEEMTTGASSAAQGDAKLTTVIDPETQTPVSLEVARAKGILDERSGLYRDPRTGEAMPLDDAIEAGLVLTSETVTASKTLYKQDVDGRHGGDTETVNITGIIDPRTGQQMSVLEAIEEGLFSQGTGQFVHPVTGEVIPLDKAIEMGLVIADKPTSSELVPEEKRTYSIGSVRDPRTGELLSPEDAADIGLINMTSGHYINPLTGESMLLAEALKRGLIQAEADGVEVETVTTVSTRTQHDRQTFSIKSVTDPVIGEELHPSEAVDRGILDLNSGLFINPHTQETMPIHEAFEKGLIQAQKTDSTDMSPVAAATAVLETKSYTIKSVIDAKTSERLNVTEAISRGVLDQEMCKYIHPRTGEVLTIKEAIDRGLIIASEGKTEGGTSTSVLRETKSYSIKSVIDPTTGEEIPISDAVRHQIVDKVKGVYWNMQTNEQIPIEEAIQRGLVIAEPVESSARKDAVVEFDKPTTTLYQIKTVKDPNTGEVYDPVEAERRGLLNKVQGIFMNPITGDKMSIKDAIRKGFIEAAELVDADYDDLPEDEAIYATMEAIREHQTMNITTVIDARTGEEISVLEAARRGLIDTKNAEYIDPISRARMSIVEAIDRGIVKAHVRRSESTILTQTPRLAETFHITGVIDPTMGRELSVNDAIQKGLLDLKDSVYIDPTTGIRIPIKEAVENGLIKTIGNLKPGTSEELESVHYRTGTRGQFIVAGSETTAIKYTEALRSGIVDPVANKFVNPSNGEIMSIDDAIKSGILLPDAPITVEREDRTGTSTSRTDSRTNVTVMSVPCGKPKKTAGPGQRTFDEALERGYIDPVNKEYVDPNTRNRMTLEHAVLSGLLVAQDLGPHMSLNEAVLLGYVDPDTGMFTDPRTGQVVTVDEAVIAGLLEPMKPRKRLTPEEEDKAIPFADALKEGLIDTTLNTYNDPYTGRSMLIQEAIDRGLIQPKLPSPDRSRSITPALSRGGTLERELASYPNTLDSRTGTVDQASLQEMREAISDLEGVGDNLAQVGTLEKKTVRKVSIQYFYKITILAK